MLGLQSVCYSALMIVAFMVMQRSWMVSLLFFQTLPKEHAPRSQQTPQPQEALQVKQASQRLKLITTSAALRQVSSIPRQCSALVSVENVAISVQPLSCYPRRLMTAACVRAPTSHRSSSSYQCGSTRSTPPKVLNGESH